MASGQPGTSTSAQALDNREYFLRLQMLIIDGGILVLRSYVDQKLTAKNTSLSACLANEKSTISRLRAKNILTAVQYHLLFPSSGNLSTSDLDITLIVRLLKELKFFGLNRKYNWNTFPARGDTSIEAAIFNLTRYKNEVSHTSTTTGIQHSDFKALWKEIKEILLIINSFLAYPIADLKQIIKNFKTCPIASKMERAENKIEKQRELEKAIEDLPIVKEENRRMLEDEKGAKGAMAKLETENKDKAHTSSGKQFKRIGRGAFGEVFLCSDRNTGLNIAVKMVNLNGQNAEVSKHAQALENEIILLRDLHHERIIEYFGSSQDKSRICIFMEYMQGGSILDIINTHGVLTEQVAAGYTKQMLDGLVYLHGKKILHRDIKGANVLLDKTGNVKLADFGTSKQLQAISNVSGLTPMIGTPHWMAPEVIKGENYGQKADIWSVGCTVVEMLTTKPPWGDLEKWPAMYQIGGEKFPHFTLPKDLSSHTDDFLGLAFKRDLKERPTAEALLQHPFVKR